MESIQRKNKNMFSRRFFGLGSIFFIACVFGLCIFGTDTSFALFIKRPSVELKASVTTITLPPDCQPEERVAGACPKSRAALVALSANARDFRRRRLNYTYDKTGGNITANGSTATWDLSGVTPGTYTATIKVDDGHGSVAQSTVSVTVVTCPTITVSCPEDTGVGAMITFTANVSGGDPQVTPTYNWTVTAGTIMSGQGTSSITVDTTGMTGGQSIMAMVTVGGYDPSCPTSASCSVNILPPACLGPRIDCPTDSVQAGTTVTVTLSNVPAGAKINWEILGGTLKSGQHTPSVTIDTTGLGNQTIQLAVELEGVGPSCPGETSCSIAVKP